MHKCNALPYTLSFNNDVNLTSRASLYLPSELGNHNIRIIVIGTCPFVYYHAYLKPYIVSVFQSIIS